MKNEFWDHVEQVRTQNMREGWNYVIGLYFKQAWKDFYEWSDAYNESMAKITGGYITSSSFDQWLKRFNALEKDEQEWIAQCQQ